MPRNGDTQSIAEYQAMESVRAIDNDILRGRPERLYGEVDSSPGRISVDVNDTGRDDLNAIALIQHTLEMYCYGDRSAMRRTLQYILDGIPRGDNR